ncbi:LacI family DNA-binding transcriptional regulator [Streptomyces sp. NPDC090106]|uniref:LacI family DNA-binding transcriptional regulator n=1 Tax=Streptomyces sp. NPDC090106 TaxID=3365946 RepID=UPI0038241B4E
MKEVARLAGVSLGTVSNVLNQPEIVATDTRARVLEVIRSLGYVRVEGARQLRGWASRMMAVMVLDLSNPFFTALASGVEQAAREADLGVLVCTGGHRAAETERHLSLITSHRIRGAVLASGEDIEHTVTEFGRKAVPFVLADHHTSHPQACSVGIDDVSGGQSAVRHLLEQGHRHIAYVAGPDSLRQVQDRRQGALSALRQAGIPSTALTALPCTDMTVGAGKDAGHRLLGLSTRPTAVFCANDLLALGLLQALYEAGLRVPDDLAVVGYDDIEFAASAVVPLTSVRRPAADMGSHCGRMLITDTTPGLAHEHSHLMLRPELVVRRSSLVTSPVRVRPGQG